MSEQKKRASALAEILQSKREAPPLPRSADRVVKSKHPDWNQFSIHLKKRTQVEAVYQLKLKGDGRDLSDLVQALLEEWLKSPS